jgi:hypothetical protein
MTSIPPTKNGIPARISAAIPRLGTDPFPSAGGANVVVVSSGINTSSKVPINYVSTVYLPPTTTYHRDLRVLISLLRNVTEWSE